MTQRYPCYSSQELVGASRLTTSQSRCSCWQREAIIKEIKDAMEAYKEPNITPTRASKKWIKNGTNDNDALHQYTEEFWNNLTMHIQECLKGLEMIQSGYWLYIFKTSNTKCKNIKKNRKFKTELMKRHRYTFSLIMINIQDNHSMRWSSTGLGDRDNLVSPQNESREI